MTRFLARLLFAFRRRPAAPQPAAPAPVRIIPVHIAGKPYTLEIYE
jgi:hypothetical protein